VFLEHKGFIFEQSLRLDLLRADVDSPSPGSTRSSVLFCPRKMSPKGQLPKVVTLCDFAIFCAILSQCFPT
jgi:hypothetical protein